MPVWGILVYRYQAPRRPAAGTRNRRPRGEIPAAASISYSGFCVTQASCHGHLRGRHFRVARHPRQIFQPGMGGRFWHFMHVGAALDVGFNLNLRSRVGAIDVLPGDEADHLGIVIEGHLVQGVEYDLHQIVEVAPAGR